MSRLINVIRNDFTPEQQMHLNRVCLDLLAGASCYYLELNLAVIVSFFASAIFHLVLFVMQKYTVWKQDQRLIAAIVGDAAFAFAILSSAPLQLSVYYPVLLWMTLSNGFRFGINWLMATSVGLATSFGAVVLTTAYWQQNLILGAALTFGLIGIPAYCSTLIRNIADAKQEADLASKAKSYFLASVSHELRTPLNAIIGYGNHLRQSNMPPAQKDMVEASVLAGEHLLHLIEQLIDVAKAGTGRTEVKKSSFRPTELLLEIRDIMAGRIADKGLTLHLQAEPMSDALIEAPLNVIRNILLNLVGNATKFTEAGSITINCSFVMRNGKSALSFTVSDTGIGIADSAKERIFQPFQQADETVMNRFGGTGLGLSICKQLAEQVDGAITVKSQIGQGSLFTIVIPFQEIEGSPQFNDTDHRSQINVLSFGQIPSEILTNAQVLGNFNLRHIDGNSQSDFMAAAGELHLTGFQLVLIPENLAQEIAADDAFWKLLDNADVSPILVSQGEVVQLVDFPLNFASVLLPWSTFAEVRSAFSIARAFSGKMRTSNAPTDSIVQAYTPKRVLVADDNRTNRNVLAAILEAAGHHVSMATDGDEALDELEKGETDILLLDVNMPRLSGIDACIMWRQREPSDSRLPIIGVTADATTETETNCLEAGMDLRITKPVNAQLLLATIEKYSNSGSAQPVLSDDTRPVSGNDKVVAISPEAESPNDVIDRGQIDYLLSIGDQSFVDTMIEGFLEDIDHTLEPLRKAVDQGDVTEFRFCAHAFKSSGNNMGARRLAHLCGTLEKISDAEFAANKVQYLAQIEQEVNSAVSELKSDAGFQGVNTLAKAG